MKNLISQCLGAIAAVGLSTLGFAQPQLPGNVQPASALTKPQSAQPPAVGNTPFVAHSPGQVQSQVGSVTPIKQPGSVVERKNQNSEVSTTIITNTSAQVAVQTIRSINENLDTAGSSVPKPLVPVVEYMNSNNAVSDSNTTIHTNQALGVAISTVKSINENLDTTSNPNSPSKSLESTGRAKDVAKGVIKNMSDGAAYWTTAIPLLGDSYPPPEFKSPPPFEPAVPPPPN